VKISVADWLIRYGAPVLALLLPAYIIAPPLIPLDGFREDFSTALAKATGMPVAIKGGARMSLLGHPMLSLQNVVIGGANIKTLRFRISWASVFDLANARIASAIKIDGANFTLTDLAAPRFTGRMLLTNSTVEYAGKKYDIASADISPGRIVARIGTESRKYGIDLDGDKFKISDRGGGLEISGVIETSEIGAVKAHGNIAVETRDINAMFGFAYPKISEKTNARADWWWDGGKNLYVKNISGKSGGASFGGEIKLSANGAGGLDMEIESARFEKGDMSITVSGGRISGGAAHKVGVAFYQKNPARSAHCEFSGNPKVWECGAWSVIGRDMTASGRLSVSETEYIMSFKSEDAGPEIGMLDGLKKYMGARSGTVEFALPSVSGVARINGDKIEMEYMAANARLRDMPRAPPLPESMLDARGNLSARIAADAASFDFDSMDWSLSMEGSGRFSIDHKDGGNLLAALTGKKALDFIMPRAALSASGVYKGGAIMNLTVRLGDMEFEGMYFGGALTLKTKHLDMDKILNAQWFDKIEDNQYLSADPLLAPFGFGTNLAITADKITLMGATYAGFVYSLNSESQKMSVGDSGSGSLLLTISKNRSRYRYLVQSNRFFVKGELFSASSPVNVRGATVTARGEMESYGQTRYDIWRNMSGTVEVSLDGGTVIGLGTDGFYANALKMGRSDAENAVRRALSGGETEIKEMEISGEYSGGDFRTTRPFLLTARHTDITGNFKVQGGEASIAANVVMRGTAPVPRPIALTITGAGRNYSLSDIMRNFDMDYLREFATEHRKF